MENKLGILVIVAGLSASGQDSVMNGVWEHPEIQKLNFKKIVTCTDRAPRPGETDGINYHFITYEKLKEMDSKGLLVEEITPFGSCHKATPKSEIERLYLGENLIWRIDLSRAADVASGNFFREHFPKDAEMLQNHTKVFFVTAPQNVLEERRKNRDGDRYDAEEYTKRDNHVRCFVEVLEKIAILVPNLDGRLDEAIDSVVNTVLDLNEEINKK